MSDLGTDWQEDEVVNIHSTDEPGDDGWGTDLAALNPATNSDDAEQPASDCKAETPPIDEDDIQLGRRNEDLGSGATPDVADEQPDDGWGEDQTGAARESDMNDSSSDTQASDSTGERLSADSELGDKREHATNSGSGTHGDGWAESIDAHSVDGSFLNPPDDAGDTLNGSDRQADASSSDVVRPEEETDVRPTETSPQAGGLGEVSLSAEVESLDESRRNGSESTQDGDGSQVDARRAVAEAIDAADDPAAQLSNDVDAARQAVDDAFRESEETTQPATAELEFTAIEQNNEGHNAVFRLELADGDIGWFKPVAGEESIDGWRNGIPDESGWKREVAAFQLDDALGLGVVPETTGGTYDGLGAGSIQKDVPLGSKELNAYADVDVDRMAVLDFITANSDRHTDNYRTDVDGRPKATDNGFCFPESSIDAIRSDFVVDRLSRPLDDALLAELRNIDDFHITQVLERNGIGDTATQGVLDRLNEIRTNGMITGDAWRGEIERPPG